MSDQKLMLGPVVVSPLGVAQLVMTTRPGSIREVSQIAIQISDSYKASTCKVSVNGRLICGSNSGNLDVAAGYPPITIQNGETLTILWEGAAQDSNASASVFYNDRTV